VEFAYRFSEKVSGISETFEVAFDALDYILAKTSLKMHIM
jgi:hypothetical protein